MKWISAVCVSSGLALVESLGSLVYIPVRQDNQLDPDFGMAISDDGRFIAGTSVTDGVREAYRFEVGVGVTMLGDLPGGTFSSNALEYLRTDPSSWAGRQMQTRRYGFGGPCPAA